MFTVSKTCLSVLLKTSKALPKSNIVLLTDNHRRKLADVFSKNAAPNFGVADYEKPSIWRKQVQEPIKAKVNSNDYLACIAGTNDTAKNVAETGLKDLETF